MKILTKIIDLFLNIDKNLILVIDKFGVWTYVLLFLVIFMETGLVITPFLPGDSLLFAAGAIAALGTLNIFTLYIILLVAAILGDTVNYSIGKYIGPKALKMNNRFIKKSYIDKTKAFYVKHGGITIILARFVPIVRTFAPFVAGIGTMDYSKFILYNVIGGFLWVTIFLFTGYFFGNLPFVQHNFEYIVIAIVLISVFPMALEFLKAKFQKSDEKA